MGCCFSCFNGENKSQSGEPNERTTLLGNPVSNNIGRSLFGQDFSDVANGEVGDEQAALNKILTKTATDVIDVSAIPTHLEKKDFMDRVKLYQKRLGSVHIRHPLKEIGLLKDIPHPEKALSESALLLADVQMMEDAFREMMSALQGIEVEPQGDLVSKFVAS